MATNCFETIIGLSDRDCNCWADGRPETESVSIEGRLSWAYVRAVCQDPAPDPFTIATEFNLPDNMAAKCQVFAGGQLLDPNTDYTKSADKEITITLPEPGQTYQVYYQATVPTALSTPAYNVSKSGLFITDLMPEEEIHGLQSCDKTIWDLYTKARQTAIKDFQAALNATMSSRYKAKAPAWRGYIGESKGSTYLTTASQYVGVRIRTNGMRSGYLKITRILAMFSATGTVTATVYDQHGNVVAPAFSIDTLGGKQCITDVNLSLPLLGDFQQEQDYFLVYEYDANNRPKLNEINCGCDGWRPFRDVNNFPSGTIHPGHRGWHNFALVGGWTGDSVSDFSSAPDVVSEYMNGVCLEVELGCDMAAGLCGMVDTFGANPFAMSVATAIQRKAAAWLVRRRLGTSLPNRNNMVNREDLGKLAQAWEAEYLEILNYLANNAPETASDCFECKPRVRTGAILS